MRAEMAGYAAELSEERGKRRVLEVQMAERIEALEKELVAEAEEDSPDEDEDVPP